MKLPTRLDQRGVEAIRVGRFGSKINTTCIVYRLGETLIDAGPPNQARLVRAFAAERRVQRVVLTHHHEDHSGNLGAIARDTGARILAPPESLPLLTQGFAQAFYQRVIWGSADRVEAEEAPGELRLDSGETLERVSAVGHSVDMTCYLLPERGWLFTGDLYVSSKPRFMRFDEDVGAQIASLRAVLARDFETVLCSHRGVIPDGKRALAEKLEYLESLCARAQTLRERGRSLRQITRELLGREELMSFFTGFDFSKRNLVRSCLEVTNAPPVE